MTLQFFTFFTDTVLKIAILYFFTTVFYVLPFVCLVTGLTGDLELSRRLAVPALPSYIQLKMEDDHTYHNMNVHDNTIHHMVLTINFTMHVRHLSTSLYI